MTHQEKAIEIANLCNDCLEGNPKRPCPGCYECDSRGAYYGALEMAEWKQEQMIEKAVEFLKNYRQDTTDGFGYIPGIVNDQTIEDFKNYMQNDTEI